jgi:hypothetical protein
MYFFPYYSKLPNNAFNSFDYIVSNNDGKSNEQ